MALVLPLPKAQAALLPSFLPRNPPIKAKTNDRSLTAPLTGALGKPVFTQSMFPGPTPINPLQLSTTGLPLPSQLAPIPSPGVISPVDQHSLKAYPTQASHIRQARTTAAPYARDPASRSPHDLHTDDFKPPILHQQHQQQNMMMNGGVHLYPAPHQQHAHMMTANPHQADYAMYAPAMPQYAHSHATQGFSLDRVNGMHMAQMMGPEQTLEELAQAVRNATTTSASDRAKQSFVQLWLTSNYQVYPDGNVPRQGLYMSYRRVCEEYQIPHINTATLGKAIRLCFPNIKTRRLGVRGNSKYHYCGIRPTNASEAEWLQRYATTSQGWDISALPGRPSSSGRAMGGGGQYGHSEEEEDEESDETDNDGMGQSLTIRKGHPHFATYGEMDDRTPTTGALMHQQQQSRPVTGTGQFSANPSPSPLSASPQPPQGPFSASTLPPSVRQINGFPDISEALGPQTGPPTPESLVAQEMWTLFIGHLDSLLDAVRQLRFDQFELNIRAFWTGLGPQHREVVHVPTVQALMARADALVYDEILESLRAQIFMPLPPTAMQQMKQMADKMEKILLSAVEGYQANFYESKIELGARFGHLVTRFLDMFQVAQALRSVLTNQKQILDMQTAWQQIDFDSVRNQTALVCNCRHEVLVQILETEFPQLLANLYTAPEPVKTVTEWVDDTYRRIMQGDFGPIESSQARSVLIRWGFVTSQVMRDLTIRSDPAFGAFQILKLFLDDWIALHVLRDVALSTNSVAASIDPQQQYLNMSPMPGDDNIFPNEYMQPFQAPAQPAAAQPTTSSTMMAALTADNTYPEPLDGSAPGAGFSFPLGTLDFSNLDPQASGGNTVSSNTGVEGLMSAMSSMSSTTAAFPEYSTPGGNSFEVEEYTHDYSMSNVATATPGHPPVPKIEDTTGGGLTSPHSQQRA